MDFPRPINVYLISFHENVTAFVDGRSARDVIYLDFGLLLLCRYDILTSRQRKYFLEISDS